MTVVNDTRIETSSYIYIIESGFTGGSASTQDGIQRAIDRCSSKGMFGYRKIPNKLNRINS